MSEEDFWNYKACSNSGHELASKIDPEIRLGAVCWRCAVAEREILRAALAEKEKELAKWEAGWTPRVTDYIARAEAAEAAQE